MIVTLINRMASYTKQTKNMLNQIAEFDAIKSEINKARCVMEFDANGMILSVNALALEALNYSESSELVMQHHRILLGRAESTGTEYQDFWQHLAEGKSQSGMFKLQSKTGEDRWLHGYYAPVRSPKGRLIKVVAYLSDMTQEKSHCTELVQEEEATSKSFGILHCKLDGTILDVNRLVSEPLGYDKKELIGKSIHSVLPKGDGDTAEYKSLWEDLRQGKQLTRQTRRVAKDGREFWFQATYVPVEDAEHHPYRIVIYSVCITAEKLKNANYEGQLNAINKMQGVIEFDLKGNILAVNENFAKVTHYSESEIVGKHHSMFVDADYKNSSEYSAFWDKLGRGVADAGVYKRISKDGQEVWLQASYNPILGLDGKPFKVVKYATDITFETLTRREEERKALEAFMIKNTLDSASTNMMMADNEGVIRYMNAATDKLLRGAAANMRKVLPHFDPDKIIGQNFDVFHKNPAHQRNLLGMLKEPYTAEVPVADLFFRLKANPIFAEDGTRFGTALEWVDITEERRISHEIASLIDSAAKGDLSDRLETQDKTGAAVQLCAGVNTLLDKMTEVLLQVREASETINTAAGEISTGNSDLSSRTEQQASSLEETAASMEELASTVKQSAENAKQANQLAAAASSVAVRGGTVVGQVVNTMQAINDSAHKIEDIISVIDGIAFQTNILALNAAVEAARAGEQGRGFAVVAGEVRNLAQRSASAAKEIKELITDSVTKTAEGTKLVENAGDTMSEIVFSVQRVTDIMAEIAAATGEQSAGIDQVNNAVTSMDEVTQQNAALVEEAAAAAESLVDQAMSLMETVSNFKLKGSPKVSMTVNKLSARAVQGCPVVHHVAKAAAKPALSSVLAKTGTDGGWDAF
jgi:methyl-accepting chemotaxis protein